MKVKVFNVRPDEIEEVVGLWLENNNVKIINTTQCETTIDISGGDLNLNWSEGTGDFDTISENYSDKIICLTIFYTEFVQKQTYTKKPFKKKPYNKNYNKIQTESEPKGDSQEDFNL